MTRTRLLAGAAFAALATIAAAGGAHAQDALRPERAPAPEPTAAAQPPMQPIPNCPVPSGPCITASTRWNGATETREADRRFHVNGRSMYDTPHPDADY